MKLKLSGLLLLCFAFCGLNTVLAAENSAPAATATPNNAGEKPSDDSSVSVITNASAELKALLNPVTNLQGNFNQVVRSAGPEGKILQKLSGKVSLKKPAQFRWEVLGKEPRLVVADGKNVWDYDKELAQVTVQTMNKGQTRAPIFFLTGDTDGLDKDFKIEGVAKKGAVCLSASDACFELKPKKEEGSFQWIKIGFKDKALKEMEMLDQLGQHSQFVFKDVKLNETIPASEFKFTPPKGVDILKNN